MTDASVRIEGLDLVQANLRRVAAGYPREQKSIHQRIGQTVLQRARARARVRTGAMRASIRLDSTSERVEIEAGQGVDYTAFQHWGTRHVSPNRFLTEPLRELEDKLVRDYQSLTNEYVEKVWVSNV